MRLKSLELHGFKSFAKKTYLEFSHPIVSIVGPNGSGKSNVVEALRFVLGEQSIKSMRGSLGADLIFKGSKNLPKSSRALVSIFFDNTDKVFKLSNEAGEDINLNYGIISISREVYLDGMNKYILNGSEVRLKDINNLLVSVKIGSSGHHIISQGEADRILNASLKDRREMVEDALGLKIYQYKVKEAARKLERTSENMKEVSILRRENAPHLNFLKRQVDKFEKAKEMQSELLALYQEYFKKESVYLEREKSALLSQKSEISQELSAIGDRIADLDGNEEGKESEKEKELKLLEVKISGIRNVKSEIERKFGRIEGMIEMEERRSKRHPEAVSRGPEEIKSFVGEMNMVLNEAMKSREISEIRPILEKIKIILQKFGEKEEDIANPSNSELGELRKNQAEISIEFSKIDNEEKKLLEKINKLKEEINLENEALYLKEKEHFNLKVKYQELSSSLGVIFVKEENLSRENENLETEMREGIELIGREVLSYKDFPLEDSFIVERTEREEMRRKMERIKIKLEDVGFSGSSEILKEYEEVSKRDRFLAREMEDLEKSVHSLKTLIADLKEKIDTEFKEGVKKINIEFGKFFALMFDGGTGYISVVTENKKKKEEDLEEEPKEKIVFEQGVEINVSLPHKKVKELNALSGGERSLTSIALLFAMSQVNPPPFLVLDETDAALDEVNSRKYGDMLEKLSARSQLVVVTHNRETMSRAGILYGVTIGGDGSSKLLSVKLNEAVDIAK